MYVNINNILEIQNRTKYWLAKEIGCNYQSLVKLCNNETNSVSFALLEDICTCLNCELSDVLIIEDTQNRTTNKTDSPS